MSLLLATGGASQVREILGRSKPVIGSVDVSDGNVAELFLRDARQTADVDAVHLSDGRLCSNTERADAAVPAEVVKVLAGVELVLGELGLARQQAKVIRRCHSGPNPRSTADGAVAAIRALGKVEFCLEPDRSEMATAAVCFEHR